MFLDQASGFYISEPDGVFQASGQVDYVARTSRSSIKRFFFVIHRNLFDLYLGGLFQLGRWIGSDWYTCRVM